MKILFFFFLMLPHTLFAQEVDAANQHPELAPRELIILKPSVDQIWGTWVTAVVHRGKNPEEFSFFVNLPRETVDFQASEGLEPKDVKLETDGIKISKIFPPGVNVISVAFAAPARYGTSALTIVSKRPVPEMTIMTPSGLLTIDAPGFAAQPNDRQDGQRYDVYAAGNPLAAGQETVIRLGGVPEGRARLWILGAIVGVLLVVMTTLYAWRTRPLLATGVGALEDREGVIS